MHVRRIPGWTWSTMLAEARPFLVGLIALRSALGARGTTLTSFATTLGTPRILATRVDPARTGSGDNRTVMGLGVRVCSIVQSIARTVQPVTGLVQAVVSLS